MFARSIAEQIGVEERAHTHGPVRSAQKSRIESYFRRKSDGPSTEFAVGAVKKQKQKKTRSEKNKIVSFRRFGPGQPRCCCCVLKIHTAALLRSLAD